MDWIELKRKGFVQKSRVVGVGLADAGAMKRLVSTIPETQRIDLTGGAKRQTVLIMDSGHVILSALSIEEIGRLLNTPCTK